MKTCTKCGRELDESEFGPQKTGKNGLSYRCRECVAALRRDYRKTHPEDVEHTREWQRRNRERVRTQQRDRNLRFFHGINSEDFDLVLGAQNGSCAICGATDPNGRGWHIDHDHRTGELRGILCSNCNVALGHFKDNTDAMRNAVAYLEAEPWSDSQMLNTAETGNVPANEEQIPPEMMAALTEGGV